MKNTNTNVGCFVYKYRNRKPLKNEVRSLNSVEVEMHRGTFEEP